MGKSVEDRRRGTLMNIMETTEEKYLNSKTSRPDLASVYANCYIALQLERIADALDMQGLPSTQSSLSDIRDSILDIERYIHDRK